jgi:serine/threonine-protein kinase
MVEGSTTPCGTSAYLFSAPVSARQGRSLDRLGRTREHERPVSASTSKVSRVPLADAPTFGKYHLIAKLGQGGMADVFLAVARGPAGFNKLVVIKRLKHGISDETEFEGMFMDEARLAARLNHPNVVQTNEVGQAAGHYYLAMEYLEGQPLNRIMTRLTRASGKPPEAGVPTSASALPEMLRVVCDSLTGLHYAHELSDYDGTPLKVVHRDVSPHNIFVTYDGVAKVVDFGIAKAAVRSAYTSTGVVKGKVSYMAPEQALSAPIDRRADIFSMGVILWELAAGERLWGNLTEVQILQKMAFGEVPRLRSRVPDAPEELDTICARALAMVPAERHATAAELRDEIEAYTKRAGAASIGDLAKLVSRTFHDRREEVRAVIQEQLRGMKDDGSLPEPRDVSIPDIAVQTESQVAAPAASDFPAKLDDEPAKVAEATPALAGGMSTTTESTILVPKHGVAKGWLAVGGAAVIGLGLFLGWRGGLLGGGVAPAPPSGGEQTTAALPVDPTAAATAVAGTLIEVRLSAKPPNAIIYVDDVAVSGNPFTAKFQKDRLAHRLRVEADGFKPHSQLVVFDKDAALDVELLPLEAAAPSAEPSASAPTTPTRTPGPWPRGPKVDKSDPFKPKGK